MGIPLATQAKRVIIPVGGEFDSDPEGGGGVWTPGEVPVITEVSGTFADGNTITITGSNFSDEATETFATNFASETTGELSPSLVNWTEEGAPYLVVEDAGQPFAGKALRAHPIKEPFTTSTFEFSEGKDTVFMECWAKINFVVYEATVSWDEEATYSIGDYIRQVKPAGSGAGFNRSFLSKTNSNIGNSPFNPDGSVDTTNWDLKDAAQVKTFRIVTNTGTSSMQFLPLSIVTTAEGGKRPVCESQPEYGGSIGWYGAPYEGAGEFLENNEWIKFTMYTRKGDLDTANGERYVKCGATQNFTFSGSTVPPGSGGHMASPNALVTPDKYAGEPIINHTSSSAAYLYHRIALPYFHRAHQETISEIALPYFSDSQERVVIGDASTWTACDKMTTYICPHTSRSNGQIQITAIESSLLTGALYAYVFNDDGLFNETGVLVRAA